MGREVATAILEGGGWILSPKHWGGGPSACRARAGSGGGGNVSPGARGVCTCVCARCDVRRVWGLMRERARRHDRQHFL